MDDWIEIFRAGDYGAKGKYNEADIDRLVANYDPARHEAPIVIGHPGDDRPAYGWVAALKRQGPTLIAKLRQVHEGFSKMVRDGAFKKRSVAIYRDLASKGPYLRHVGFLGATPPEIKGLADLKFADGEFLEIEQEETMEATEIKKTVLETIKEYFAELIGGKKDATGISEERLQSLLNAAVEKAIQPLKGEFAEQLKTSDAKIVKLETDLAEARKTQSLTGKAGKVAQLIEPLARDGRFPPAFREDGLVKFLETLDDASQTVIFGETGKERKFSQLDFALAFLGKLPQIVPFGEIVTEKKEARVRKIQFTEGKLPADPASVLLAEEAEALAIERKISYGDALKELRRERALATA
jgi:hypothetical protein